jgi:altronate hydrolase
MRQDKRQPGKLSELKFGLECGGSDGLSGITANPMLGRFSDYVIANGGTTVLTEVPEMFGAEQLLMSHCRDEATFDKLVTMVNDFKQYFIARPAYLRKPSPGNKAGGSPPWKISRWAVLRKRAPARWWMSCATASA